MTSGSQWVRGLVWSAGIALALLAGEGSWADSVPGIGQVPQIPAFLPMASAVAAREPMPIDGTWTISTISKTVRIERGRIFAIDGWTHLLVLKIQPGMVVIQDVNATGPGTYSGKDLPLMGPLTARVMPDRTLAVEVHGALGPARYQLIPLQLDNQAWYEQTLAQAGVGASPGGNAAPPYEPPAYSPPAYQQPAYPPPEGLGPPDDDGQYPPQPDDSQLIDDPPQADEGWAQYAPAARPANAALRGAPTAARSGGDPSFGPPVITCGHVGEFACKGKSDRIAAVSTRAATWWGCPNEKKSQGGRKIYFTPHNGGECWACPDGYRRTLKPIHEPDACNKEGLSSKTTSASLHSTAWGCGPLEFRKGKQCFACPNNAKKVAFLGVFNPEQTRACEGQPWICTSGVVGPLPNVALQKIGPPVKGFCEAKGFDLVKTVRRLAETRLELDQELGLVAARFVNAAKDNRALRRALHRADVANALRIVKGMAAFQQLMTAARARGYESFSIGTAADVQLGYGANQELGFVVDWDETTKVYGTTGVSQGPAFGADVGLSVGLWKKKAHQLSGYGHGIAVSADVGLSVGAAAWFDFYPVEFAGVTFVAGVGAGFELGEYNQVVTVLYDPNTPVASR